MDENRKSQMGKPEGAPEFADERSNRDSMSGRERMRNQDSSAGDLGSSSDRAMLTGRGSEARDSCAAEQSGSAASGERGRGESRERNRESSDRSSRGNSDSIRDRDLGDEDQAQQPDRSRSTRER